MTTSNAHTTRSIKSLEAENARLRAELERLSTLPQEMASAIARQMATERTLRDEIAAHKETEERLRQRERDMQSVLDNLPSMIGYWDRNLRNRFANHAYRTWFGLDPDQIPGMHIRDVIGEERFRLNLPHIEAALAGRPQTFERAIPAPDGSRTRHSLAHYIPDVVDGEVQGFYVLVSNITEVKEAQAAALASNARFDELARAILVGVYTCRLWSDGSVVFDYVSPRFCQLLALNADEVLADASKAFAVAHPEDLPSLVEANREAAVSLEPFHWEGRMVVNGEIRWMQIDSSGTRQPDGCSRWNGVVTDVTERKNLELALRLSNTDLKQFAYVASHDLQTPLRNIVSYLQLLDRRYGDKLDDDAREFIGFAVNGAKQMTALINDLLEYSRVDSRPRETTPVDMTTVVAEVRGRLGPGLAAAGAELVVEGTLPVVPGDRIQLTQLVQNLVGNALKYRDPGRPLVIRIHAQDNGPMTTLAIADNGIGIEPEFHERIFNIFQRLHTATEYEGTGIGLALCKRVAERHGGRIWVESTLGQGSTFKVSLPA